jgi:hypothetical protein
MGRYYDGDIEGKFWFGVQSSDDADYFGVTGYQPERLEYEFEQEDLDGVETGVKSCLEYLGPNKARLDKFFDTNHGYNDEMLVKAGFKKSEIPTMLQWYARLHLGEKIAKSIKINGHCYFSAEM